jgi:tight adherence protein B
MITRILISALVFAATGLLVYYYRHIKGEMGKKAADYKDGVDELVKRSMAGIRGNEITRLEVAAAAAALALAMLTGNFIFILIAVPVMIYLPKFYISNRQSRYMKEYGAGLVGFLESVTSSLKAGLSLVKAFQVFAARDRGSAGNELEIVLKKIELGMSMQEALQELAGKIPLKENVIIISALNTAFETGGNITEVLENIQDTIRKRDELNREVSALTSQGVMSGIIVGLLPVFLIAAVSFIDPEFMQPLFSTTTGNMLLVIAVIMEITGAFAIRAIVNVR